MMLTVSANFVVTYSGCMPSHCWAKEVVSALWYKEIISTCPWMHPAESTFNSMTGQQL